MERKLSNAGSSLLSKQTMRGVFTNFESMARRVTNLHVFASFVDEPVFNDATEVTGSVENVILVFGGAGERIRDEIGVACRSTFTSDVAGCDVPPAHAQLADLRRGTVCILH